MSSVSGTSWWLQEIRRHPGSPLEIAALLPGNTVANVALIRVEPAGGKGDIVSSARIDGTRSWQVSPTAWSGIPQSGDRSERWFIGLNASDQELRNAVGAAIRLPSTHGALPSTIQPGTLIHLVQGAEFEPGPTGNSRPKTPFEHGQGVTDPGNRHTTPGPLTDPDDTDSPDGAKPAPTGPAQHGLGGFENMHGVLDPGIVWEAIEDEDGGDSGTSPRLLVLARLSSGAAESKKERVVATRSTKAIVVSPRRCCSKDGTSFNALFLDALFGLHGDLSVNWESPAGMKFFKVPVRRGVLPTLD